MANHSKDGVILGGGARKTICIEMKIINRMTYQLQTYEHMCGKLSAVRRATRGVLGV